MILSYSKALKLLVVTLWINELSSMFPFKNILSKSHGNGTGP